MFEVSTSVVGWRCALEAVDTSCNIARAYSIYAVRDLFGHVVVELSWGRIARRGASLRLSFASETSAEAFIRRTLVKRASAPRRIGVAYHQV